MLFAISVLTLLTICTVLCFVQAVRIQNRYAIDGHLPRPHPYLGTRMWLVAGIGFGFATFLTFIQFFNPPPASF